MTIKDLKQVLGQFSDDATVLIANDEELNLLFEKFEVAILDDRPNTIVVYGVGDGEVA